MDLPIFTKNGDTSFLDLLCKVERCHYGFQKEAAICSCTLQEGGGGLCILLCTLACLCEKLFSLKISAVRERWLTFLGSLKRWSDSLGV